MNTQCGDLSGSGTCQTLCNLPILKQKGKILKQMFLYEASLFFIGFNIFDNVLSPVMLHREDHCTAGARSYATKVMVVPVHP